MSDFFWLKFYALSVSPKFVYGVELNYIEVVIKINDQMLKIVNETFNGTAIRRKLFPHLVFHQTNELPSNMWLKLLQSHACVFFSNPLG